MTEKGIPMKTGAYPQYIEGLEKIMDSRQLTLNQARNLAIKIAKETQGIEQIPFINAAYKELKKRKKK